MKITGISIQAIASFCSLLKVNFPRSKIYRQIGWFGLSFLSIVAQSELSKTAFIITAISLVILLMIELQPLKRSIFKIIILSANRFAAVAIISMVGLFWCGFSFGSVLLKLGLTALIGLVLLIFLMRRFRRFRAWVLSGLVASVAFSSFTTGIWTPPPAMAATESFVQGAYIIDMGQTTQTFANGVKPYGLIYDLTINNLIPVKWAINPSKSKDGVDFSANGKSYSGSAFIIPAEYADEAATVVANWQSKGVVVDGPIPANFTAPIYETITSFPNGVLDLGNGGIAQEYYTNAEIPEVSTGLFGSFTTYRFAEPTDLNSCDDIFIMPHADPEWATHSNLIPFNQNKGYIWAACHAVSVLENVDDPSDADADPDMNFLSTPRLAHFGDDGHDSGTIPYTYRPDTATDPIMQFLGTLDEATLNGSEQIYLPAGGASWRDETTVSVYDPDHPDVVAGTYPPEAAVVAYGRGFGDNNNGMVMYEGGHSHNKGSSPAFVAAQRAFFNFVLLAGIERRPEIVTNIPTAISTGETVNVSASASGGSGSFIYRWYNSCGGTFANDTAANTTFTAPAVSSNTACNLRVVVQDTCSRRNFTSQTAIITPPLAISSTVIPSDALPGQQVTYTITVENTGNNVADNLLVSSILPSSGGSDATTRFNFDSGSSQFSGITPVSPTVTTSSDGQNQEQIVWDFGGQTLEPGESLTITFTATIGENVSEDIYYEELLVNFVAGGQNYSIIEKYLAAVNIKLPIKLEKTVNLTEVAAGEEATYTITVTNQRDAAANDIVVYDFLPFSGTTNDPNNRFQYVDGSSQINGITSVIPTVSVPPDQSPYASNPNQQQIKWDFTGESLLPGASFTITFKALVGEGVTPAAYGNNIRSNYQFNSESLASNVTDTATITITPPPPLKLSKTVTPTNAKPGETVTYTIAAENRGTADLENIAVFDFLPTNGGSSDDATNRFSYVDLSTVVTIINDPSTKLEFDKFELKRPPTEDPYSSEANRQQLKWLMKNNLVAGAKFEIQFQAVIGSNIAGGIYDNDMRGIYKDAPEPVDVVDKAPVTVVALQPPTIDLDDSNPDNNDYQTSYTINGSPTSIASANTVITDSDSSSLSQAVIQLTNPLADDLISIDATALAAIASGTITADTTTANQITLGGSASLADYALAIRLIEFSNSGSNLDTSDRTITVQVTDETSLTGNIATTTVSVAVPISPNIVLVKRITAINRGATNERLFDSTYIDDSDSGDNESGWPTPITNGISNFLAGSVDEQNVRPQDEVEYTIYFLNNGGTDAINVSICDVLRQPNLGTESLLRDAFGSDRGIQLQWGDGTEANSVLHLTNATDDGDEGSYYPPHTDAPATCNSAIFGGDWIQPLPASENIAGAVLVSLNRVSYPNSIDADATPAYGLVSFTTKIQ